jgi:hypothetical protein
VGNDQIDQILKMTKLLGAKEVVGYIKEHKLTERRGHRRDNICFDIIVAFENGDIKAEEPSEFAEFINKTNQANATWEAIDLLKKLLKLDYVTPIPLREKGPPPNRHSSIPFLMVCEQLISPSTNTPPYCILIDIPSNHIPNWGLVDRI